MRPKNAAEVRWASVPQRLFSSVPSASSVIGLLPLAMRTRKILSCKGNPGVMKSSALAQQLCTAFRISAGLGSVVSALSFFRHLAHKASLAKIEKSRLLVSSHFRSISPLCFRWCRHFLAHVHRPPFLSQIVSIPDSAILMSCR